LKIDYANYVRSTKEKETDELIIQQACTDIKAALKAAGVHGKVNVEYYKDAALVMLDGKYYNMFNYETKMFFKGSVGDYGPLEER